MSGLRRGKWTTEEEAYVERVIKDFNSGLLDAAPGTTLRSYLANALGCDPMARLRRIECGIGRATAEIRASQRITKKFTGDASIGKRVFHPREGAAGATLARARRELSELEDASFGRVSDDTVNRGSPQQDANIYRWRQKLEAQERDAAAEARRRGERPDSDDEGAQEVGESGARRVAAWLETARTALAGANAPADVEALVAEGERLRRELADHGRASAASKRARKARSLCTSSDEEATALLVDFLRSAQKSRARYDGDDDDGEGQVVAKRSRTSSRGSAASAEDAPRDDDDAPDDGGGDPAADDLEDVSGRFVV